MIVPTLNEERNIAALLEHVTALPGEKEIIVADGGSTDSTSELAVSWAEVFICPRGRGPQCNAGALRAGGDILFFLHTDSRLERDALPKIAQAVERGAVWGCLKLRFDDGHWLTRLIAWCSNMRVRWRGIAFGDQGIFMTRSLFAQIGGIPDLPLMEDYALSLLLKGKGLSPEQLDSYITSSARRFVSGGRLRVWLQMWSLRAQYRRGVDISILQSTYRNIR
uniref:Glycosyl transferase, family 2 n=1 Tax=uncultured bacterium contig00036 TaxID=1181524 RepID=A0A806KMB3_9BACT|nr:glycosyl transferase, family 2 [uncultured bacterium contig00036]